MVSMNALKAMAIEEKERQQKNDIILSVGQLNISIPTISCS